MKKLEIKIEHKVLIESIIRENPKFRNNEELMDIFLESVYKKSYLLMDAIRDVARLRRHLTMICDSSIEQILKEKRKFEKTKIYRKIENATKIKEEIVSLKKNPLEDDEKNYEREFRKERAKRGVVNLKEEIQRSEKYDSVDMLIDPLEFCPQKRVSERTIERLVGVVKKVSAKFPKKHYYDIFALRYIKRYDQTEIARKMRISQVELSKRFVEMIKLTRENI